MDSVVSDTNGFINFLTSDHGDARRETLFLLCWLSIRPHFNARCILWSLRSLLIEIRKTQLYLQRPKSNSQPQWQKLDSLPPWSYLNFSTDFFKILKLSGPSLLDMMTSTLQPHFLSRGLLWQRWLSYPLCTSVNCTKWLYTWALNPIKLNDKI